MRTILEETKEEIFQNIYEEDEEFVLVETPKKER